jgi:hypothetical protein
MEASGRGGGNAVFAGSDGRPHAPSPGWRIRAGSGLLEVGKCVLADDLPPLRVPSQGKSCGLALIAAQRDPADRSG